MNPIFTLKKNKGKETPLTFYLSKDEYVTHDDEYVARVGVTWKRWIRKRQPDIHVTCFGQFAYINAKLLDEVVKNGRSLHPELQINML